ncbi:MAG TPA: flagellar hook-basal body complex protein FliE [Xanthobacteraceae bacterium]|nr:flagellar hook-basal body complex protein FliE [Xanthobacteraceae bacterium]
MASPITAANAYAALAKLTDRAATAAAASDHRAPEANFGAMLKETLGAVIEAGQKSDVQTQALAAGKANIVDVVTAVSETEVAIQTLVSVRDRVIQSYEEIMRMPI